jgi:hypothetical protein
METYMLLAQLATSRHDGMLAFSALPDAPVLAEDPIGPLGRFTTQLRRWRLGSAGARSRSLARDRSAFGRRGHRIEVPS